MKNQLNIRHAVPKPLPFPNAATPREKLEKAIDFLLTGAVSTGFVVTLMFLLTM